MAPTFKLISSVTVGAGGAASIDFTSIPATYTDLCLEWSTRDTTGSFWAALSLNASTSSFTGKYIQGEGTGIGNGSPTDATLFAITNGSGTTSNTFSNGQAYFPNYLSSTNKTISVDMVTENNATVAYMRMVSWLWSNTSAINQITLTAGGTFAQYSTAYLYGISKN